MGTYVKGLIIKSKHHSHMKKIRNSKAYLILSMAGGALEAVYCCLRSPKSPFLRLGDEVTDTPGEIFVAKAFSAVSWWPVFNISIWGVFLLLF